MIPSKLRLESWTLESLSTAHPIVRQRGEAIEGAAVRIETQCNDLPELRAWEGQAHTAASEAFRRAKRKAGDVRDLADALASALDQGFYAVGSARGSALGKAADLEDGPFLVSDRWVVTLKPVEMSAEQAEDLIKQRNEQQGVLNPLVFAVGQADTDMSNALRAAAEKYGFVEPERSPIPLADTLNGEPSSDIPLTAGMPMIDYQQHERDIDAAVTIARTETGENDKGETTKTLHMQDGSKKIFTDSETKAGSWYDRPMLVQEDYAPNGTLIATTNSFATDTGAQVTAITYEDRTRIETIQHPDGTTNTKIYPEGKEPQEIPADSVFFSHPALTTVGGVISGVETATESAAKGLPTATSSAVSNLHYGAKFGGPALAVGTALYDVYMADSSEAQCQAGIAGAASVAGGWGLGALGGSTLGPVGAGLGAAGGSWVFGWLGSEVGKAVCY